MSLKLGSNGLMVSAWTRVMLKRFASYATGTNGQPIKVDGYFGFDEQKVQKEYQLRTGQPQTGEVSDKDLHNLGLLPTLLTMHGTGQADPFGIGYPADIARRCLDLYWWQPVGNWPAKAVPMNGSVDALETELVRLVSDRRITPGPIAMVDYSQGSIGGGRIRNRMRNGDLRHRYPDFIGSASFGNPMRPADSYAGVLNPGGQGIDPNLETFTEPGVINLAARGDIYTTTPNNGVGEMMRSIFNLVFSRFLGKDSIFEQVWEMATNPVPELANAAIAAWNGGMFIGKGTGPHVRYHLDQCPGTGVTYYEYAVNHMRTLANNRLQAIANS